jgi:hypothetical protein
MVPGGAGRLGARGPGPVGGGPVVAGVVVAGVVVGSTGSLGTGSPAGAEVAGAGAAPGAPRPPVAVEQPAARPAASPIPTTAGTHLRAMPVTLPTRPAGGGGFPRAAKVFRSETIS